MVPETFMIVGFVIIGVLIAARFAGTSMAELRRLARASIGAFLIGIAVTMVVALAVAWITGLSVGKVVLAYAPGGIEAMAILAFVLDMDRPLSAPTISCASSASPCCCRWRRESCSDAREGLISRARTLRAAVFFRYR